MKKICVVTGSRAEYGLLYPVMKKIESSGVLQLQIIATTMHMAAEFGKTFQDIVDDGFIIDEKIENLLAANSSTAICKSTGLALGMIADAYSRLSPDAVLLLGDRFETHAAATAALLMNIPIIHIHGGEITKGAIDEQIRHSISKMAHLHFTATESYRNRLIQMGEQPDNVIVSGAPGIDNMMTMSLLTKDELEEQLSWMFGDKNILFTYHPETLNVSVENVELSINTILSELERLPSNHHVLFTAANADECGDIVNEKLHTFVSKNPQRYKLIKNLGQLRYLSAMKIVDVIVGNSSSGIIEAASFHKPVVNIGNRQKNRLQNQNVLNCHENDVCQTLKTCESEKFLAQCAESKNIYGDGSAASIIVHALETMNISVVKSFNNV